MRSIEQQRNVEIRPGFSPRAVATENDDPAPSPSREPDTRSPNALLDGPIIQSSNLSVDPSPDVVVKDGIVSFGK
jgi:hypothetical protein